MVISEERFYLRSSKECEAVNLCLCVSTRLCPLAMV